MIIRHLNGYHVRTKETQEGDPRENKIKKHL